VNDGTRDDVTRELSNVAQCALPQTTGSKRELFDASGFKTRGLHDGGCVMFPYREWREMIGELTLIITIDGFFIGEQ